MKQLLLAISVLFITGCTSTLTIKPSARLHQISANTNGNYLALYPNSKHGQCGLNQHLSDISQAIDAHPIDPAVNKRKILVSIHGGLNSISNNIERTEGHYEQALDDGYYPIFIGWRSGALTTLKDRYFGVRNGVDRSLWVTIPSSPFYLGSDLLKGVAAIPESLWDQGANFITTHSKRMTGFTERDIAQRLKEFDYIKLHYSGRGNEKSTLEQLGYATRQVIPGVLRLASTPLIEGMADKAWGIMKRRAKTLIYRQGDLSYRGVGKTYSDNHPFPNDCEKNSPVISENAANGVVAQLFRTLQKRNDIEVTLVGHSMGAIIANDIVKHFDSLNYSKIIHMASADSIRNLMDKTLPYLRKNEKTKFYNLTLHPTNEEQEQSAFGLAPEGSLLIWLDYILINPETSLDRVAGRWDNIKWALPFFKGDSNMHFKMFGLRKPFKYTDQSLNTVELLEPINHGAFGKFSFWKTEFYWK